MKDLTKDQIRQARDLVLDAQAKMEEAQKLLKEYVELTGDRHTEAYIVDHLVTMTSSDHGFLSRDTTLDDVLKELDNLEFNQEEEEDWEVESELISERYAHRLGLL